ncbi:Amine oxidase, partial [Fasciola gigantica]
SWLGTKLLYEQISFFFYVRIFIPINRAISVCALMLLGCLVLFAYTFPGKLKLNTVHAKGFVRKPAVPQFWHRFGPSNLDGEIPERMKRDEPKKIPEHLDYGPLDEPNSMEYTKVLSALRTQIGSLYAVDISGKETNFSYAHLSRRPWTEQLRANFLWAVNLHVPNKTQRTAYFEQLLSRQNPVAQLPRFAHAIIFHPPEIREYLVGPMNAPTEIQLLRTLPYQKRPLGTIEYEALVDFLAIQCTQLDSLLQEVYGASYFRDVPSAQWRLGTNEGYSARSSGNGTSRCQTKFDKPNAFGRPHCLMPTFTSPMITHEAPDRRRMWLRLMHQVITFIQHPVDIQFYIPWLSDVGPVEIKHGICLFESTVDPPGAPVRRHYEFALNPSVEYGLPTVTENDHTNFGFGAPGRALTVRFITSLFNYDYLFDVVFHTTGVVEFAVTPSGHIHVDAFYPWPEQNRFKPVGLVQSSNAFGFLSNTDLLNFVIHHHLFHFKLDVDVIDQRNAFDVVYVYGPLSLNDSQTNLQGPGKTDPSLPPGLWMTKKRVKTEMEARFHTKFEVPAQYLTCAKADQFSRSGPPNLNCVALVNKGAIKTLLSDTHTEAFAWTRHQLSVTRYHDDEPRASSIYNGVDLVDPVVNFTKFSENDESIENADLVLWVTVGNYHLPRHEDLPNTVTSGGKLAFYLTPHNLFRYSPDALQCDRFFTKNVSRFKKLIGFEDPEWTQTVYHNPSRGSDGTRKQENPQL